jgi:putative ABC transport system permease protein
MQKARQQLALSDDRRSAVEEVGSRVEGDPLAHAARSQPPQNAGFGASRRPPRTLRSGTRASPPALARGLVARAGPPAAVTSVPDLDTLLADLRICIRDLLRSRRRTASAASAAAFGVAALMLAAGFIDWIFLAMRDATIHSQLGHAKVVRPGFYSAGLADPFRFLLPGPDARELHEIESVAHVQVVAPRLSFNALLSRGETTVSVIGEGVMPDKEGELGRSIAIVDGHSLEGTDAKEVVVGEGLAKVAGLGVGDTVVLLATTASGGTNMVEATIAGLSTSSSKAVDDWAVRVPLPLAQELLRVSGANTWTLLLDRTDATATTVDNLRSRIPAERFEVVPWTELADFYNKTVALFSRQVAVVRWVIAIIIVLSIANSMMMTVMERTGEIGTSLALGVPRRRVLRRFLMQGAILGAFGGLAGIAIGEILGNVITTIGIPMPAPPGSARGYIAGILLTPRLVAECFALAVVTSTIASVYPAWKASRMPIVDALRHNR